ncbi:MAG: hypothetical protein ACRBB0_11860 [Pelagimonas sp.]|uniref:hypothetical protein n=1 Tax=Pelagimonas sp. TaxID=2073170 RepID=UPI003D6A6456
MRRLWNKEMHVCDAGNIKVEGFGLKLDRNSRIGQLRLALGFEAELDDQNQWRVQALPTEEETS